MTSAADAMSPQTPLERAARPFVKWVGGKRQLLAELAKALPDMSKVKNYYEPFLGGGALFFELRACGWKRHATLNDANDLLARAYMGVRDDVADVVGKLQCWRYDKDEYLARRAAMPGDQDDNVEAAAWVVYMNRCCFNGLWRVNRKGQFNVPFGRYDNPAICDEANLRACARALHHTRISSRDFEGTVRAAEKGDLVYFDPPYVPASASADFTAYTEVGFGPADQQRLVECARKLKERGVHVILSNADVPIVHKLYAGFTIRRVDARRNVNSKAGSRGPVGEVIIT